MPKAARVMADWVDPHSCGPGERFERGVVASLAAHATGPTAAANANELHVCTLVRGGKEQLDGALSKDTPHSATMLPLDGLFDGRVFTQELDVVMVLHPRDCETGVPTTRLDVCVGEILRTGLQSREGDLEPPTTCDTH